MTPMPALRNFVLVYTFRSHAITTPGSSATTLFPSSHFLSQIALLAPRNEAKEWFHQLPEQENDQGDQKAESPLPGFEGIDLEDVAK